MIAWLEQVDRELVLAINGGHSEYFDNLMLLFSEKLTWIPLYVVCLIALWKAFGLRNGLISLLFIGLTIALADMGSVKLFKEVFLRYRPCHNLEIGPMIHLVDGHCGGKYGFVSSHAANHFAIAVFLSGTIGRRWKWTRYALILWALVIAYSRIHLGVHYPLDVVAGGLYGSFIALSTTWLWDRLVLRRNLTP